MNRSSWLSLVIATGACSSTPNTVEVALSPSVISSLDGRTTVTALVAEDTTPIADHDVHITIDYVDRNGTPHALDPIDGTTNERGVFTATLEGLAWDGTGKVTVDAGDAIGEATFGVLDRTPPKVTILSPTTDMRVGPGLPVDIQVHVTDEIGVGQVILDTTGDFGNGRRSTTLVSGTLDGTVTFRIDVPTNAAPGPNLKLFALATDLSGNSAVAMPLTLTIDPAIVIATPPGLTGTVLTNGSATALNNPHAIAASPKDGKLYVADVAAGACADHCIWQVDPANGTVATTPVFVGLGVIEGVAFDATGDNLYYTDRQRRTGRLTWDGTAYATPVICNNVAVDNPSDPFHLVFDTTLGLLAPDGQRREVVQVATCATTTTGTDFTGHNFDEPRGIALGAAGEIYVSDLAAEEIVRVDRTNGAVTAFESRINNPYGIEWLGASTTPFANSLMVASRDRIIESTKGAGTTAAAYLRNPPIDLAFIGGTMFVLTTPSQNDRGRIFKVTGF